jgi:hypothetical protein
MILKIFIHSFLFLFPWKIRRVLLNLLFKYEISIGAHIGLSLILPSKLVMGENSKIKSFCLIKGLESVTLANNSQIGNFNWIIAEPKKSKFFQYNQGRKPELLLHEHSSITSRHIIDCTDSISIGNFQRLPGIIRNYLRTPSIFQILVRNAHLSF